MAGNIPQNVSSTESPSKVAKSSGATQVNLIKHEFTWTISNFSYSLNQVGHPLLSPVFTVGTENKTQWYLAMYPNLLPRMRNNDYLGLYVALFPGAVVAAQASCKLCIVNDKNIKTNIFSFRNVCDFTRRNPILGWSDFARRKFLQNPSTGCLPNGSLTIFCELTVVDSIANSSEDEGAVDQEFVLPAPRLLADFSKLYEKPKLTDVTIVTRGKEFPAHKVILAARSPYFSAIFEQEETMKQQNNRVCIMDVLDDVMNEVLRFIYTGVAFVDKMADNLLVAADKYQIKRLKALCEKSLADSIAVENTADRLVIAELYDAAYLKKHALEFICVNATEVMETESYKALHHTHPDLIDQALQAFAAAKIKSKSSVGVTSRCLNRRGKKRKRAPCGDKTVTPPKIDVITVEDDATTLSETPPTKEKAKCVPTLPTLY